MEIRQSEALGRMSVNGRHRIKTEMDRINNHLYKACMDVEALRKALEDAREEIANGTFDAAYFLINSALGEGDKE